MPTSLASLRLWCSSYCELPKGPVLPPHLSPPAAHNNQSGEELGGKQHKVLTLSLQTVSTWRYFLSRELTPLSEVVFSFEKRVFHILKGKQKNPLVRVPCSGELRGGSDLIQQNCFDLASTLLLLWCRDKHHWKKMPLLFFSQNILNWRNVKIFSRSSLPLP